MSRSDILERLSRQLLHERRPEAAAVLFELARSSVLGKEAVEKSSSKRKGTLDRAIVEALRAQDYGLASEVLKHSASLADGEQD